MNDALCSAINFLFTCDMTDLKRRFLFGSQTNLQPLDNSRWQQKPLISCNRFFPFPPGHALLISEHASAPSGKHRRPWLNICYPLFSSVLFADVVSVQHIDWWLDHSSGTREEIQKISIKANVWGQNRILGYAAVFFSIIKVRYTCIIKIELMIESSQRKSVVEFVSFREIIMCFVYANSFYQDSQKTITIFFWIPKIDHIRAIIGIFWLIIIFGTLIHL